MSTRVNDLTMPLTINLGDGRSKPHHNLSRSSPNNVTLLLRVAKGNEII